MNKEFFEKKVKQLSDEKLLELLKLRRDSNQEITEIAISEANARKLQIPELPDEQASKTEINLSTSKLEQWNWGAFLLAPIWTLSHKLEKWTLLTFIPGINIIVHFYLGIKGNKLAYSKSKIKDTNEFMLIQAQWNSWAIRIFWISLVVSVIWLMTVNKYT